MAVRPHEATRDPRAAARERAVWEALAEVPDPEIPAVSVVDLGMVRSVEVDGERLRVELLPTFVGCPALDMIREAVAERLAGAAREVVVEVSFAEPWTSARITADGRRKLRESGFAPPAPRTSGSDGQPLFATITTRPTAACPYCGSPDTAMENPFGPTLCRAILYCNRCRQPFEQFKAV
ncbi:MAG TPA: 1,2-phenylacetyl-CoA epoxidase subunit PaaD [Actinomycetes bacterium]|jgi:ring-1,2-phenylacetyl-CoA epoxidase subunit PaaD|nr:1,2-phenylacetyl-CoA epoxidase subunit PaaD [Actinomycetes bacterium]